MVNFHVRCEVSEGGLDFCRPDEIWRRQDVSEDKRGNERLKYDERAFAFGATLDRFVYRTANEKWEPGCHEKTSATAVTDQLGPNSYDARNNKLISWENCSMYWDDDPAFMISESDLLRSSSHRLSSEKFHSRIAAAMAAIYHQQEPGRKVSRNPSPRLPLSTPGGPVR